MSITQNDLNKEKKQLQQVMNINNVDYNEWLHEQHQKYLSEHSDIIMKALELLNSNNRNVY